MAQRGHRTALSLFCRPKPHSRRSDFASSLLKRDLATTDTKQTEGHKRQNEDLAAYGHSLQQNDVVTSPVDLLNAALYGPPRRLRAFGPWEDGTAQDYVTHKKSPRLGTPSRSGQIWDHHIETLKGLQKWEQAHGINRAVNAHQESTPRTSATSVDACHVNTSVQDHNLSEHLGGHGVADREPDASMHDLQPQDKPKQLRHNIRKQLYSCEQPRDVLQVVARAMQRKNTAVGMARLFDTFRDVLYRIRENAPDTRILATINAIVWRFRMAGIMVDDGWLLMGLKFAARSRSLPAMRRYLQAIRQRGLSITSDNYRCVIAKFSIGRRGLGEMRNGRWKKSHLLQILKGFPDLTGDQACHLETFLDREDWRMYHGWIAVLARCKDVDEIMNEWKRWKQSKLRAMEGPKPIDAHKTCPSTQLRGDRWFVEQLIHANAPKTAWEVFKESGMLFEGIRDPLRGMLLDHAEYATVWNDAIAQAMMDKYAADLLHIEKALGVRWVPGGTVGYHVPMEDQLEDAWERLAVPSQNTVFGYPFETEGETPVVYAQQPVPADGLNSVP